MEQNPFVIEYLKELLLVLQENCSKNNNLNLEISANLYPISKNGFAERVNVLLDENKFKDYFCEYGFVVGVGIDAKKADDFLNKLILLLQRLNIDLKDTSTWIKDSNNCILSRGFLEVYHDNFLSEIRQNIHLYIHHVVLWNSPFLWTSFDRVGIKTSHDFDLGLPLHVDQNPRVHPHFNTIQGVLVLSDCPVERGTFQGVPKSWKDFRHYADFANPEYTGEYVELPVDSELYKNIKKRTQIVPLQKGSLLSWDSRTTHSNTQNKSNENRYVVYVSTGLEKAHRQDLIDKRVSAWKDGDGYNLREAYMHASKKPRFDSQIINKYRETDNLTPLGKCLYSIEKYGDIL